MTFLLNLIFFGKRRRLCHVTDFNMLDPIMITTMEFTAENADQLRIVKH